MPGIEHVLSVYSLSRCNSDWRMMVSKTIYLLLSLSVTTTKGYLILQAKSLSSANIDGIFQNIFIWKLKQEGCGGWGI